MSEGPTSVRCVNRNCSSYPGGREGACVRCWKSCVSKSRYATKELAWAEVERLRDHDPPKDPTLSIYRCRIIRPHWHVGHATGRHGQILRKRVEKARRKTLWKETT